MKVMFGVDCWAKILWLPQSPDLVVLKNAIKVLLGDFHIWRPHRGQKGGCPVAYDDSADSLCDQDSDKGGGPKWQNPKNVMDIICEWPHVNVLCFCDLNDVH